MVSHELRTMPDYIVTWADCVGHLALLSLWQYSTMQVAPVPLGGTYVSTALVEGPSQAVQGRRRSFCSR